MSDPDRRKPRARKNGSAEPPAEAPAAPASVEQWLAQRLSAFAVPDPTEEDETEIPTQTRVRTPNPPARPTARLKPETRPEPVRIEFDAPRTPPAKARVEPAKAEPAKVEPAKAEPAKVEPAKVESPKVESPKADLPKVESPKVDSPKVDSPKVGPRVERLEVVPPKVEEPPLAPFRVSDPSWEEPEVVEAFDRADGPDRVEDFDTRATAPMALHREVIRDAPPPVRELESELAETPPRPVRDQNSPPPARVRVSPPPVTLRAPLPSLPPVDEDATEGDVAPIFVRPSTEWGNSSIAVDSSDLGFELPEPPSSEVTKPSSGMSDAWDLLGESDGRGFPAVDFAETEERTPPGGWSTPGPAPSLSETPATAHVRLRQSQREGEEKVLDQLIAEAEAQSPAGPRRRPGPFSRYGGPGPVALDGALDEVFHGSGPPVSEDTRELLSETHHGGEDAATPWGGDPAPSTDEATSWMPNREPAQAEVRDEPTQATDAPKLDDGPTVVPRALPPLVPSPPPAPTRTPSAMDARGFVEVRANTLSEQPTADPANRRASRVAETLPPEPPTVTERGSSFGDLLMTGFTGLSIVFAVLTFGILLAVITAFLVPLLS